MFRQIIFKSTCEKYRIVEESDDCFTIDDLKGDMFNPKYVEIPAEQLVKEEKEFEKHVEYYGVYSYYVEKLCEDGEWENIGSCCGFVGLYDKDNEKFSHDWVNETIENIKDLNKYKEAILILALSIPNDKKKKKIINVDVESLETMKDPIYKVSFEIGGIECTANVSADKLISLR